MNKKRVIFWGMLLALMVVAGVSVWKKRSYAAEQSNTESYAVENSYAENYSMENLWAHMQIWVMHMEEFYLQTVRNQEVVVDYKAATDDAFREAAEYLSGDFVYDGRWQKILCIGDSLTEGVQSGAQAPWENPWPIVMEIFLEVEVENAGIGGSTIWSRGTYPMSKRIMECGEADAVFIMGGENDWMFGDICPMGSLEEPGTFIYDADQMFSYIKENYADADVFVVLPLETNRQPETESMTLEEIRDIEAKLAKKYGFYVIDLPGEGILSAADPATREAYYSDDIHPNTYGYQVLGTLITARALQMSE